MNVLIEGGKMSLAMISSKYTQQSYSQKNTDFTDSCVQALTYLKNYPVL